GFENRANLVQRTPTLRIRLSEHANSAAAWMIQPEDHAHCGGLTSTVRAEESRHASGQDIERKIIDSQRRTVSLGQSAYLDHERSPSVCISASSLPEPAQDISADPERTPKLPWSADTDGRPICVSPQPANDVPHRTLDSPTCGISCSLTKSRATLSTTVLAVRMMSHGNC